MGQKVHPIGLRLGVINNWKSRWFFGNKTNFRSALLIDDQIRNILMEKYASSSVVNIEIERQISKINVIIHTVKPGMVIGRGGKGLEDVKSLIVKALHINPKTKAGKEMKIDIKVEPVKKPYLNAYYVAQSIADKLVKGMPHRYVIHQAMNKVIESAGKGVKIQLGGRINGADISRREKYFQGTVPASTIREDIDFAHFPALTKSGYVGVKVWICR